MPKEKKSLPFQSEVEYNRICVMCPTYGRAGGKLNTFIRSALETRHGDICFSFVVNKSDTESVRVIHDLFDHPDAPIVPYEILEENTDKPHLAKYFNQAYRETKFNEPGTLVSMFGDDMEFRTPGWDRMMVDKMNDVGGFGIVYGDDDYCQHDKLCVYFVTSRAFVESTGKPFMCEEFAVDWIDNVWMVVAKGLNAAWYLPGLHVFHNHATRPGKMDATWERSRAMAAESNSRCSLVDGYAAEIRNNVKASVVAAIDPSVGYVMTTYDRIPTLAQTVKSWNKAAGHPKLMVCDDNSHRKAEVTALVSDMIGATFSSGMKNVGVDKNNDRAIRDVFDFNSKCEAVAVIDSDVAVSPVFALKYSWLWQRIRDDEKYAGGSLFNAEQNHKAGKAVGVNYVEKQTVGGCGALYKKTTVESAKFDLGSKASWDNQINSWAIVNNRKFLCTKVSHVQHTGYVEGTHISDGELWDCAENFAGYVEPIRKKTSARVHGPILFAAMARLGDVVAASMIANMLIEKHGYDLTWLAIPRYTKLIYLICPQAKLIVQEPIVGGPYGEWSETNTWEMAQKYPDFAAHINAQAGARENHGEYTTGDLRMCEFLAMLCEDVLGVKMDKNYRDYLRGGDCYLDVQRERIPGNLAVISPGGISSPALTDEKVDAKFRELKAAGYNPRILVETRPPNKSIREVRERYLYGYTVPQCIAILKHAKHFVGNDSGMAWCSLFSGCTKEIYHPSEERLKFDGVMFSDYDANAKDLV